MTDMRRIYVIDAHPDDGSFCSALADAYAEAARGAGHQVRFSRLRYEKFDLVLRDGYHGDQPLELDLEADRERILWCDHLVLVTPNWWWNMPALLKGWIDRTFVPGFAVAYSDAPPRVDPLLGGRSVRVIYTQDAKRWLTHLARGDLFWKVVKRGVLKPVGFAPVRRTEIGPVGDSSPKERQRWLARVHELGASGR